MGRIVVSENVTLDGVFESVDGPGDWLGCVDAADRAAWAAAGVREARTATALLLGRRTYEWFVARGWASRPGDWADALRDLPKYVVTGTGLGTPTWANTSALTGDAATGCADLARRTDGDLLVLGSARLLGVLLARDLVGELRLTVYPIVVGAGTRLFGDTAATPLRLVESRTVGTDLTRLTYRPRRTT
ncbi:dihydrofolate reductase family protein [Actinocatenispora rupis]|uniref:Deaminase reductase n=1 Tax=Actinocatenispora rupis TaxID=519421 RepID=A0A8J3J5T9_9ACTN|nr:dihydrofolate reductase family protein [Actinocatenispora rupis]GID14693.1 deaminase reductase [Actinocatenispora rupis]